MLQTESLGTSCRLVARGRLLALLEFEIAINHRVHIEHTIGNLFVEVTYFLEFQLLDKPCHKRFFKFDFSILEFSLNHFLGKQAFFHLRFLECKFNLSLGSRCLHDVEPILFWLLHRRCHNLHLVATVKHFTECHHLIINARARACVAHL